MADMAGFVQGSGAGAVPQPLIGLRFPSPNEPQPYPLSNTSSISKGYLQPRDGHSIVTLIIPFPTRTNPGSYAGHTLCVKLTQIAASSHSYSS